MRKKIVGDLVDTCNSKNLLCEAVTKRNMDLVRRIIDVRPSYLNKVDDDGFYPMNWCNDSDHFEMFEYLHSRGANINNVIDGCEPTLLHEAVSSHDVKLVDYILDNCEPTLLNIIDDEMDHNALARANMYVTEGVHDKKSWIYTMIKNYMDLDKIDYDYEKCEKIILDMIPKGYYYSLYDKEDIRKLFKSLRQNDSFVLSGCDTLSSEKKKELLAFLKDNLQEQELEEIPTEEFSDVDDIGEVFESEVESEVESEELYSIFTPESWKKVRPGLPE